jgi:hypothetical protein
VREGDDILELNGQSIVAWRLKSVATFLKEVRRPPTRASENKRRNEERRKEEEEK